ncbi:hypothetical protein PTSG_06047 [Salpingoeca rosetta]|uniref:SH3 domain-containing protein n=1 Tax=Salpingoeca rosetta (strain ATCC 50818 / BSB-021) TaxID=946362 RepID=F2UDI9_SALR5|nr:uncharacterized protein PTSG_06047 [Salpingoeca rosetta]EGD74684.1 hypothetical protein PTSG_06047 [Salpingoeca rosetta]|eukprot:XP_004992941.1 hypothetical protein PTSG_06047 [Salpingoeca rosetta]
MSTARKRCMIQGGCTSWEFDPEVHMCRNCSIQYKQVADAVRKYVKAPVLRGGLVVTKPIQSPFYLGLQEGDKIDILDILPDNTSIIVRTPDDIVGYFNLDCVATEEEIVQNFQQEEEKRQEEEERRAKEAQRQAEEQYEQQLRERMKLKAIEDKERRLREAEQRRIEHEQRMAQVQTCIWVVCGRGEGGSVDVCVRVSVRLCACVCASVSEQERLAREDHEKRVAEAREMKRIWDLQQEQYEREKKLANQPQWKRDLIERKQQHRS